ncbi:hypothetical protein [Dactylosporangium salmoneum]|uniref:Uncharacterized protein n=1 Tax=Dactylosporangium salmoneum TaxID=53361 RepID=A0ABN3G8Y5_9ACTN
MARIRTIKPEFWVDEKVVELDPWARLLFIGMWNFADDQGFIDYAPKRIKMQVFPGDVTDVEPLIDELLKHGLIRAYQSPIGPVLHVTNWGRHQRVDHAARARFDARALRPFDPHDPSGSPREGVFGTTEQPYTSATCRCVPNTEHENPRERSREMATDEWLEKPWSGDSNDQGGAVLPLFADDPREGSRTLAPEGKGKEGKGKEVHIARSTEQARTVQRKPAAKAANKTTGDPDFDAFYAAYPKRVGRARALTAWTKAIKRASPAEITAGATRYAAERAGQDPAYTAHPASWLNADRWLDEPSRPQASQPGRSHIYRNPDTPDAYAGYEMKGGPDAA